MIFEPIISVDKHGKERIWSVKIDERTDGLYIVRETGQVGGKISSTSKRVPKGKAGRSLMEQAVLEATSMYNKKVSDDTVPKPMLAEDYNKHGHKLPHNVLIQPKLDGVRMIVRKNSDDTLSMFSRTGKEVTNMKHLEENLKLIMNSGDIFDGEVYDPDITFEEISGKFRKNSSNILKYFIFDTFGESHHTSRHIPRMDTEYIRYVETHWISKDAIDHYHDQFVEQGYEGIMVRDPDAPYVSGRTKYLQKFKKFIDEEFEIVGVDEGSGTDEGTAIFICKTKDDQTFHVRPKGTLEIRREYLRKFDNILGKFLTVKFQEYSDYGIPRFPVGICVRDYE